MAAPIGASTSIIEVTVSGIADGQAVDNVLTFKSNDYPNPFNPAAVPDLDAFMTRFRTLWRNGILIRLSEELDILEYLGIEYSGSIPSVPPQKPFYQPTRGSSSRLVGVAGTDQGQVAGDYLPTFNTVTGRKVTSVAGRTTRGSIHLAPIVEADTAGDGLTLAAQATFQTSLSGLLANIDADSSGAAAALFSLAVLSKKNWLYSAIQLGGIRPAPYCTKVQNVVLNSVLGSVVRRKKKNRGA